MKLQSRTRVVIWVVTVLMLMGGAVPSARGQAKRAMSLVDLLEVPSLGAPDLSPDGTQVVYVLSQADWEENKRIGHIWRINTDGTGQLQLTHGEEGEASPKWSRSHDQ